MIVGYSEIINHYFTSKSNKVEALWILFLFFLLIIPQKLHDSRMCPPTAEFYFNNSKSSISYNQNNLKRNHLFN